MNKNSAMEALVARTKRVWGNDTVVVPCDTGVRVKVPSFSHLYKSNKIPITAILAPTITGRLKGPLDKEFSVKTLSKLLTIDEKLIENTRELLKEQEPYGASLTYISYSSPDQQDYQGSGTFKGQPKKTGVYYMYKKITGYFSNWQTTHKVRSTNFGRTGIKADQLMIACTLMELFPTNEHGEPVEWREDIRFHFTDNLELDIWGENLATGLCAEYQGHQGHYNNPEVMARDKQKVEQAAENGDFFLVIDRINHLSPEKALRAVMGVIDRYQGTEKKPFLKLMNKAPSIEKIHDLFAEKLPERAQQRTQALKDFCNEKGHVLLTQQEAYLPHDEIEYQCGKCSSKNSTTVKRLIETAANFCKYCKGDAMAEMNRTVRASTLKTSLSSAVYQSLPRGLVDAYIMNGTRDGRYECPDCKYPLNLNYTNPTHEQFLADLETNKGFPCPICEAEMQDIKASSAQRETLLTQKHNIEKLFADRQLDASEYKDRISFTDASTADSQIELTLPIEVDESMTKSVRTWIIALNNSDDDLGKTVISKALRNVRGTDPDAYFINGDGTKSLTSDLKIAEANCGRSTTIGGLTLPHPNFKIDIKKTSRKLQDSKKNEQETGQSRPYCMLCADFHVQARPGSNGLMLDVVLQRFKLWMAALNELTPYRYDVETCSVSYADTPQELGKIHTTKDKLKFKCEGSTPLDQIVSYGNFFNEHKGIFITNLKNTEYNKMSELFAALSNRDKLGAMKT